MKYLLFVVAALAGCGGRSAASMRAIHQDVFALEYSSCVITGGVGFTDGQAMNMLLLLYSDRRLRAGFMRAALMAWKLTVRSVKSRAPAPAARKIQGEMGVR
jgi:hypothetical protein